jgi:hypothetical protein
LSPFTAFAHFATVPGPPLTSEIRDCTTLSPAVPKLDAADIFFAPRRLPYCCCRHPWFDSSLRATLHHCVLTLQYLLGMTSKDIEVELKDGLLTPSSERNGIIETILSLPAVIIGVV